MARGHPQRERNCPRLTLDIVPPTLADIDRRIEERVAAEHEIMMEILAELLADIQRDAEMRGPPGPAGPRGEQGPPGKLPLVKPWTPETVHYEGDVVAYDGGTFQARRDTGQPPSHADWICLATAGRDGSSITVRSTFNETAEYRRLDVVALNGGSFVALKDKPGPCPGSGWQLVASQGKRGARRREGRARPSRPEGRCGSERRDHSRLEDRSRALPRHARHERRQGGSAARIARTVRAVFLGGTRMIEREVDQGRGERESARAMAPEVVAARIVLRVAELRLLAAWTSVSPVGSGFLKPRGRAVSVGSAPNFWPLAARKFTASLSVAKCHKLNS